MSQEPPSYEPTTIETVFELLDKKLVSFGVPGALSFVGITKAQESQWKEAIGCFVGAVAVWTAIKVGKKLAPKLDEGLDSLMLASGQAWSAVRSDPTGHYLQQQARLCEEFTAEGFNPDRTTIPLLEEVFVPLDLSGVIGSWERNQSTRSRKRLPILPDAELLSDNLNIWKLLARSRKDAKFRQMSILAKGGMGKTTLLRHITLIYGQGKQRRYRAPTLVPFLLRLRDWVDVLTHPQPPTLPTLIAEHHVPGLSKNNPLTVSAEWAEGLLQKGKALVLFDGFDEIPDEHRPQVSQWLSDQMQEYRDSSSVFILTSRPAGFKDYVAQKPASPIYVKTFNTAQQNLFIRRWYLCQERACRSEKQRRQVKQVADERSDHLIAQLQERREELGYMAENPLLLNMLVTYHRFDPTAQIPRQRLGLYQGICKLQLDDRPKARGIQMVLSYGKSLSLLQEIALGMVRTKRLTLSRSALLNFLEKHPLVQREEVDAVEWLKQMTDVSELLVEREPGEYEFPHATFQGFFAATRLALAQEKTVIERNVQLIVQNWTAAIWRETVLLYTAQLPPKVLNFVIREACKQGSEASDIAALCLKEYPRPEKLSDASVALLQRLETVATDSKYKALEDYLKAGEWKKADYETYRLMIMTVGKEEGQWFDREDFETFPCEDLKTLDQLWVKYSNGNWGFSVQKRIWQECGSPMDYDKNWEKFGDRVGWRKGGDWLSYNDLTFDLKKSPRGEFPVGEGVILLFLGVSSACFFSRAETCKL